MFHFFLEFKLVNRSIAGCGGIEPPRKPFIPSDPYVLIVREGHVSSHVMFSVPTRQIPSGCYTDSSYPTSVPSVCEFLYHNPFIHCTMPWSVNMSIPQRTISGFITSLSTLIHPRALLAARLSRLSQSHTCNGNIPTGSSLYKVSHNLGIMPATVPAIHDRRNVPSILSPSPHRAVDAIKSMNHINY